MKEKSLQILLNKETYDWLKKSADKYKITSEKLARRILEVEKQSMGE